MPDLVEPRQNDLAVAIPELLEQRPSVLIMADIGRLPEETYPPACEWIEQRRHADPLRRPPPGRRTCGTIRSSRVTLRQGERALGARSPGPNRKPLADIPATVLRRHGPPDRHSRQASGSGRTDSRSGRSAHGANLATAHRWSRLRHAGRPHRASFTSAPSHMFEPADLGPFR